MSSAWGASWGSAWGNSWGTIATGNIPQSGAGGGYRYFTHYPYEKAKKELRSLEREQKQVEKKIATLQQRADDTRRRRNFDATMQAVQDLSAKLRILERQIQVLRERLEEIEQEEMALMTVVAEHFFND